MELHRLGEAAWLAYLADEVSAARSAVRIRETAPAWLQDAVPAYRSLGVYFDADRVKADHVAEWIREVVSAFQEDAVPFESLVQEKPISIPVCYEHGPDLGASAARLGLTVEALIALHASEIYSVHAIGFVPGFPYLGYLPDRLCGLPRLDSPRIRVEPGSVGITGRQTGIYPLARPGGWPLIGRTPLTLVDVADEFFPLKVGDRISFRRIDRAAYDQMRGVRLARPTREEPR